MTGEKADGVTYTPKKLADFVADQIVRAAHLGGRKGPLRLLDPAVGAGELLLSLVSKVKESTDLDIEVSGYDTSSAALGGAETRLRAAFPGIASSFTHGNFLEVVAESVDKAGQRGLFDPDPVEQFDLIIANPPYVRTQVMGASRAREIARKFGLKGRVDIYYAFLLGMGAALDRGGVAGIIVSNRFMSTRSGESVRRAVLKDFDVFHAWDFGDTKLFDAAVLPAVLLLGKGKEDGSHTPKFTSIYQTDAPATSKAHCPVEAVGHQGVVEIADGRRFLVVRGALGDSGDGGSVWRVATEAGDGWLATVEKNRWGRFGDIGKIRVGVKTCADNIFIRDDWESLGEGGVPELLRPLTTHHIGRRYKALRRGRPRHILYPHEVVHGIRRAVDIEKFQASKAYLARHRAALEGRTYVREAGREWFEIWVPQDPAAWAKPKLVFRDISEEPMFWVDLDGSVVNGDCYWLRDENHGGESGLLWLAAAVANSKFIETFYDHRFNNKLYAGRRRFITQYVEEFPLPDPGSPLGREIIANAKRIYDTAGMPEADAEAANLENLVWEAFGLGVEKM